MPDGVKRSSIHEGSCPVGGHGYQSNIKRSAQEQGEWKKTGSVLPSCTAESSKMTAPHPRLCARSRVLLNDLGLVHEFGHDVELLEAAVQLNPLRESERLIRVAHPRTAGTGPRPCPRRGPGRASSGETGKRSRAVRIQASGRQAGHSLASLLRRDLSVSLPCLPRSCLWEDR